MEEFYESVLPWYCENTSVGDHKSEVCCAADMRERLRELPDAERSDFMLMITLSTSDCYTTPVRNYLCLSALPALRKTWVNCTV
jgi:hypothetical protein